MVTVLIRPADYLIQASSSWNGPGWDEVTPTPVVVGSNPVSDESDDTYIEVTGGYRTHSVPGNIVNYAVASARLAFRFTEPDWASYAPPGHEFFSYNLLSDALHLRCVNVGAAEAYLDQVADTWANLSTFEETLDTPAALWPQGPYVIVPTTTQEVVWPESPSGWPYPTYQFFDYGNDLGVGLWPFPNDDFDNDFTIRIFDIWLEAQVFFTEIPTTYAPPLRQFPRDDGLGASPGLRQWPAPRSVQRSNRRAGHTYP